MRSFQQAVESLKLHLESKSTSREPLINLEKKTRFYEFPHGNLRVWMAIPLEAHSDDKMWRALVPNPGSILGAVVEE